MIEKLLTVRNCNTILFQVNLGETLLIILISALLTLTIEMPFQKLRTCIKKGLFTKEIISMYIYLTNIYYRSKDWKDYVTKTARTIIKMRKLNVFNYIASYTDFT